MAQRVKCRTDVHQRHEQNRQWSDRIGQTILQTVRPKTRRGLARRIHIFFNKLIFMRQGSSFNARKTDDGED